MIEIKKGEEPEALARLRNRAAEEGLNPKEAYELLNKRSKLKNRIRNALVREQGGLCAYCMCRIPRSDVEENIAPIVIEHVIPRNPEDGRDVGQGLDYYNLLAVCHGNRGSEGTRRYQDLVCDAHRKNIELKKVNPCRPETLASIYYGLDGKIHASDEDVKKDLIETLNLNCPAAPVLAERKAVLDGLLEEMGTIDETDLADYCRIRLEAFNRETNPKTPYVGILIWYLHSMLDGLTDT